MLTSSTKILSNALTLRNDKSILLSRTATIITMIAITILGVFFTNYFIQNSDIINGLFYITLIMQIIFLYVLVIATSIYLFFDPLCKIFLIFKVLSTKCPKSTLVFYLIYFFMFYLVYVDNNRIITAIFILFTISFLFLLYLLFIDDGFISTYPKIYNILLSIFILLTLITFCILIFYATSNIIYIIRQIILYIMGDNSNNGEGSSSGNNGGNNNGGGGNNGGNNNTIFPKDNKKEKFTSGTASNTSKNTESSGKVDNEKISKPKPNLSIKVGPQSDLEKDTFKIGMCTHDEVSLLKMNTKSEVDNTYCDFSFEANTQSSGHKALDSVTDNAFLCNNCHAILCKNCVNDYSDDSE